MWKRLETLQENIEPTCIYATMYTFFPQSRQSCWWFMYNDWMIFRDDKLMKTFFRSVLPQDEINDITKRYEFCAQTKVVSEISHWLLIVEIVPRVKECPMWHISEVKGNSLMNNGGTLLSNEKAFLPSKCSKAYRKPISQWSDRCYHN